MKRCPSCNLNYSDDTLEFCLQGGLRLLSAENFEKQKPFTTHTKKIDLITEQTVSLPISDQPGNFEHKSEDDLQANSQNNLLKETLFTKGNKTLEIAPVVISLAHNWWQGLYLNNQYYYSFTAYFFSANFLMWLLLLVGGVIVALISLKRSSNKIFAITSLVILAINLLLILVPRR